MRAPDPALRARRRPLLRALGLGLALALLAPAAAGQDASSSASGGEPPAASPASAGAQEPTEEDLEHLLTTLESETARAELVTQIRALLEVRKHGEAEEDAEPGAGASVLAAASKRLAAAGEGVRSLADRIARPRAAWHWLRAQALEPKLRVFWLRTLAALAVVFSTGAVAALGLRRALAGARRRLEGREPPSFAMRVPLLAVRTVLDLLPVAAFGGVAHGVLALAAPPERVRLVALTVVQAVVVARGILVAARLVVTPLAPGLRLVRLPDADAAFAFVWIARFVNVGVYGFFAAEAAPLLGASAAGRTAILHLTGFAVALLALVLVLQVRERVATKLRGASAHAAGRAQRALVQVRRRVAEIWHVLASLYILAAYFVWALDVEGGFLFLLRGTLGTLGAVVGAILLARLGRAGVTRLFGVAPELRQRFPGLEGRADRYLPVARGIVKAGAVLVAAAAVLEAWGLRVFGLLASGPGLALLAMLLRLGLIVVLAFLAWEIARIAVARHLGANDAGATQRARTLYPLAQTVLLVLIVAVAGMTLLAELGVNIGPLLAGAGILGLAVGFGAQSLVKDVITGAFILFEDAIAVGDVVEVAGYTGVVEAINVRSIRHRDLSGTLHTIPFSSVTVVRNLTKVYAYYLSDVGVAYREDTDEVVALLRRIVDEMREEPGFSERILEPLEVMGVNSFDDSAVAVRVRIKTLPGDQWAVGREFNRRMKKAFDEADIEIPFPHRTLYFGVDKDGTAPAGSVRLEGRGSETPGERGELETPEAARGRASGGRPPEAAGGERGPAGAAREREPGESEGDRAEGEGAPQATSRSRPDSTS